MSVQASVKPVENVDASRRLDIQKRRLRESCREFESVMVSYLLKTMRASLMRAEEPESAREMYEDMLTGEISKQVGQSSGFGIGDMLYSKLEPALEAQLKKHGGQVSDGGRISDVGYRSSRGNAEGAEMKLLL